MATSACCRSLVLRLASLDELVELGLEGVVHLDAGRGQEPVELVADLVVLDGVQARADLRLRGRNRWKADLGRLGVHREPRGRGQRVEGSGPQRWGTERQTTTER
jgi:hypothetical protein